jgi:hypothetical protein
MRGRLALQAHGDLSEELLPETMDTAGEFLGRPLPTLTRDLVIREIPLRLRAGFAFNRGLDLKAQYCFLGAARKTKKTCCRPTTVDTYDGMKEEKAHRVEE